MARVPRHQRLVEKAEAAMLAAIEIYNKPSFPYREESFAILALNAWELLLKARLLLSRDGDRRVLYIYEPRNTASGSKTKKLYLKRNRAGNPHTLGLGKVIATLESGSIMTIPMAVKANIDALVEIRDNAVHFVNPGSDLAKRILEVGTASVKNFIELGRTWFQLDLSSIGLFLMPIGFLSAPGTVEAISVSQDEKRLLAYIAALIDSSSIETGDYHAAVDVSISFKRAKSESTTSVIITNEPNAMAVQITDEDIRKTYPWDYAELMDRLQKRYVDFKMNERCHDIRRGLMADTRYVKTRQLDPGNPKSGKKDFYNPNILTEFDKHYTR
jgi:hypothetical protein